MVEVGVEIGKAFESTHHEDRWLELAYFTLKSIPSYPGSNNVNQAPTTGYSIRFPSWAIVEEATHHKLSWLTTIVYIVSRTGHLERPKTTTMLFAYTNVPHQGNHWRSIFRMVVYIVIASCIGKAKCPKNTIG
jgi:hypothetical protein